jgi:hypothetical protein
MPGVGPLMANHDDDATRISDRSHLFDGLAGSRAGLRASAPRIRRPGAGDLGLTRDQAANRREVEVRQITNARTIATRRVGSTTRMTPGVG